MPPRAGRIRLFFSADCVLYSVQGEDNVLNLAQAWKDAEFNIFGDGGGSEASFNNASTIVVRTRWTMAPRTPPLA